MERVDPGPEPPDRARRRALSLPDADPVVATARLRWRGDQPASLAFDDIYHSPDGIAEVQRVFLAPSRFDERARAAQRWLRVGEIGFGTGLNFVTAAERFLALAPSAARLHFVSFEAQPVGGAAFARLAARRAPAQPLYRDLAARYPPPLRGWHRRTFAAGRVVLSLFHGDAADGLADVAKRSPPFDVWLLDGFAPRRNPSAWAEPVIAACAALSRAGAALATFTAAGDVRRLFERHGFAVERIDQRPHKRHTLAGTYAGAPLEPPRPRRARVAIAGAGLAGSCAARALAEEGVDVLLLDGGSPHDAVTDAVLHARLVDETSVRAQLRTTSYLHAAAHYAERGMPATGALQFAVDAGAFARSERIAARFVHGGAWLERVDSGTASALLGTPVRTSALYFPDAARIALAEHCAAARDHTAIDTVAARLIGSRAGEHGCEIETTRGTHAVEALIVCTGADLSAVPQASFIEVLPVEGQLDVVAMRGAPRIPIVGDGYLCPRLDGHVAIGATYEQRRWASARASAFNLERATRFWSAITGRTLVPTARAVQRGTRGVSSDRLPVVGPVPGLDDRLIVDLAHGSSGTSTAPLAAAIVAELCGGEFAPVTSVEMAALAPGRFLARQARRGLRHGARSSTAVGG